MTANEAAERKPRIDHSIRTRCAKHGADVAATYVRSEQRYECFHCAMERYNGPGEPAATWFDR